MNSKSYFVALLVCGILLAALAARNGSILLLAIPFSVYLIAGILMAPVNAQLQAHREVSQTRVAAGEPAQVRIVIENRGNRIGNLHVADLSTAGLTILSGSAEQRAAVGRGESIQLAYQLAAKRGAYEWTAVRARASDSFGLFETVHDISAPGELLVVPISRQLHAPSFRPRATLHAPGQTVARLPGAGTDFWGIREYRPGDPLRRLNWRLAGRYPRRRFTNEYEGQEIADFGLVLDARRMTNAGVAEEALFEYSVSAAASLSESLLRSGNRVALLIFGQNTTVLYPGYGKRQLSFVLRELSSATLGPNISLQYLEYFPVRVFPSRSVIIAFSPVEARDMQGYAGLRAHGYDVLLISPDAVDYLSGALPVSTSNRLAIRAARLERVLQLRSLLKMGIGVIDWQVNTPLDALLHRTAAYMARRRNL